MSPGTVMMSLVVLACLQTPGDGESTATELQTHRIDLQAACLVIGRQRSPVEDAALEALQLRVEWLTGGRLPVQAGPADGPDRTPLLVIGNLAADRSAARILRRWGLNDPGDGLSPERSTQAYLLAAEGEGEAPTVLATASSQVGAAYACADLASHLICDERGLGLMMSGRPDGQGRLIREESPAVPERGVYLNIPSPLPPLTVHDWDEDTWLRYLDQLMLARLNRLYFYLWQDLLSDYASPPERRDANRRLHERLRWMIPEAQRRGIRVTFLFCPTFMPREVWQAHPDLHARIEYVDNGFPCICPSQPESWPLMQAVYDHELEWFKAADGFQLWFYDPGGCLCDQCAADLAAPLLRQIQVFGERIRASNPQAELQLSLWPIWHWEIRLQRRYGLDLLDRLQRILGAARHRVAIVDNAEIDVAFLAPARERGFRTQAFMFSTNVETPFIFLNPQLVYLREVAGRIAEAGFSGAFCHRLYPGSKFPNTLLAAHALWEPHASAGELSHAAALALTAHPAAAEELALALQKWDTFLYHGATGEEGRGVREAVERALGRLPAERRATLEALSTGAQAMDLLGQAADCREDAAGQAMLAEELHRVLAASASFHAFAAQAQAEFPHLVRWAAQGWRQERF